VTGAINRSQNEKKRARCEAYRWLTIVGQNNLAAMPPNQLFLFLLDHRRLMGAPFPNPF
jgi:hypothetical protein